MAAEHEFNAPADLVEEEEAETKEAAEAKAVAGPGALVGTWNACNAATRAVVRVVIGGSGGGTTVHVFGACVPNPCDWGSVPGISYAANVSSPAAVAFTAQYKFKFKETIVTGVLDSGSLIVETFSHFTDGSGRSDVYTKDYLCKGRAQRDEAAS